MSRPHGTVEQRELRVAASAGAVVRALRAPGRPAIHLDGAGDFREGWSVPGLIGIDPEVCFSRACSGRGEGRAALDDLSALLVRRRSAGGPPETGVAVLLAYELFAGSAPLEPAAPRIFALAVDRSLRLGNDGVALFSSRLPEQRVDGDRAPDELLRRIRCGSDAPRPTPAGGTGGPRTSLPREAYLQAVSRIKRRIESGDVYQANLCQRFEVAYDGDVHENYRALARRWPAPHSAFLEAGGVALASISPETFVHGSEASIETVPIKGTRPRGATVAEDREAARELLTSGKDRAELLMIVDLERNDLGRVCRTGSIEVLELAELRSFAAVHHLVARVRGCPRQGLDPAELISATFPGGSITGAPKIRAMEILRELEPVQRSYFTGSLLWFGDDGSIDSSILIRSLIFTEGRCYMGAGGGVVADSDPEQEWMESNHKARALTAALGFQPEEAT